MHLIHSSQGHFKSVPLPSGLRPSLLGSVDTGSSLSQESGNPGNSPTPILLPTY